MLVLQEVEGISTKNLLSRSMKFIVEVNGLWKEYQRGAQKQKYLSLRDNFFKSFNPSARKDKFWALEDINFNVEPGESVAIIGKNGAGKSTLLKILSKITPPTKGEIVLRGRLASLLEVGTGFHPELTGRENIYLNGSILGLGRQEINRQFDAIVDFSGIEAFLETPLKHYSSGMQLRLAFAVAAHLEPEILVIDEVLAVGDHLFQKKCIDKMTDISKSGRTLIFVSHNTQAIKNLCKKGIILDAGKLKFIGDIDTSLNTYLSLANATESSFNTNLRKGAGQILFTEIRILNEAIIPGEELRIRISLESEIKQFEALLDFGLSIRDSDDIQMIHISNRFINKNLKFTGRAMRLHVNIDNHLRPGIYFIAIFVRENEIIQDWLQDCLSFTVADRNPYGFNNTSAIQAKIFPDFQIDTIENDNP